MEEICDNAIDDDNDGLIDINDPDCICERVSIESMIPNPSFEEQNCCPSDHSQMNCAVAWIQPSFGTSDYIHHCGYNYNGIENTPLNEFPDGDGVVGFLAGAEPGGEMHIEYIGACLNSPMLEGSTYVLKLHVGFLNETLSPPFSLSIYGAPSCGDLPFTTTEADCPLSYPAWNLIGQDFISSNGESNVWLEFPFVIQPSLDINAIVIGVDCQHGKSQDGVGYLLDNLRLTDEDNFDFELVDLKHPCDPEFTFAVAKNSNFSYQWYKEGIALLGEASAQLSQMYGEGKYQLRIINELTQECRIADDFDFEIPLVTTQVFETFCEGNNLVYMGDIIDEAGIYKYTLTSADGCDSIITLNVEEQPNQTDTLYIETLPGEAYHIGNSHFREEGEYLINLSTSKGCDSTIALYLKHISVFIPNAFSPNGDNINDYFEVFTSNDDFVTKEMSIFDRWGKLLYVGNKWDGRFKNKMVSLGVYVSRIRLIDHNGKEWVFSQSITLIR